MEHGRISMLEGTYREKSSTISIRDINYILFRHKWKVIIFFLAAFGSVAAFTFLSPKIYRSEAMLLVRLGRESITLDPTATTGQVISVGLSRESETNNELEVLRSRDLVEKVVDKIGPSAFLKGSEKGVSEPTAESKRSSEDRNRIIYDFMAGLKIEVSKGSNIIHLSYEGKNPGFTQRVLTKLIDSYLDKHITVHRTAGSYEFFNQQTEQLRAALTQKEESLRKLKNRTGIASVEDQRRVLLTRINDLQKEIEETDSALASSQARILVMEKTLSNLPTKMVTGETGINSGVDMMRAKLYELRLKEQELLSRYTEKSVSVQEIRRQIVEAEALLSKEEATRTQVTRGPNEAYKTTELALLAEKGVLSSLQAKAKALSEQLAKAREEQKVLNDDGIRIVELQREINVQEGNYRKYLENLEQARIDHALETQKISNITIVQPPTYPLRHVRPRKPLNLALGLFLGMIGGIALAFFSEYVDHTLRRPEDVEGRLKLPILAAIPHLNERIGIVEGTTKSKSEEI